MVCIIDSGETFEFSTCSNVNENIVNTHYFHYLIVDDIYELANMAEIYCKYNDEYNIYDPRWGKRTLIDLICSGQHYSKKIIKKIPVKMIDFIHNTNKVFHSIELNKDFMDGLTCKFEKNGKCIDLKKKNINENTLTFSLISKQLLKEKNTLEMCLSFMKSINKHDFDNINSMLTDIYRCNFDYNIILVDKTFRHSIANVHYNLKQKIIEFITKAYDIIGLQMPIQIQTQIENEENKPYHTFLHLSNYSNKVNENICSICIEPFQEKCRVAELICKHKFHKHCIYEWLENNLNCPCCREKFTKMS